MAFSTASSPARIGIREHPLLKWYLVAFSIAWTATFIGTTDRANWWAENALTMLFIGGLALGYRRFKFSDASYSLMFVYILLHIYGAMYTYAENPFGYWLQDLFNGERNHYDRIVHFRKFVVKVVVFDLHVGLPLRLFRLEQRQILGFYAIFPGMRGVLTTTSAHCARWRRAWSISTSASMASAIGVARMPTQGSCRPSVATSIALP